MDAIEMQVDAYVNVEKFFSEIDDDLLADELRSRGFTVFTEMPQVNDPVFIGDIAERILSIINLLKSDDTQEDGIKLVNEILTRTFSLM